MVIQSIRHRALRRLLIYDDDRYFDSGLAQRVCNILTVLVLVDDMDEFIAHALPHHKLSGKRHKEWSVSISGNWQMTFKEEMAAMSSQAPGITKVTMR